MRGFAPVSGVFVAAVEPIERSVLLDVIDGVIDLLAPDEPDLREDSGAVGAEALDDLDPLSHLHLGSQDIVAPDDPALLRLLPDASLDPEVATELRRLTEHDLRSSKANRLRTLRAVVEPANPDLTVEPAAAEIVLTALNDIRLVLGARLGLESDEDTDALRRLLSEVAPGETRPDALDDEFTATRRFLLDLYDMLSVLQDSLVTLLIGTLDDLPSSDHSPGPDRSPGA